MRLPSARRNTGSFAAGPVGNGGGGVDVGNVGTGAGNALKPGIGPGGGRLGKITGIKPGSDGGGSIGLGSRNGGRSSSRPLGIISYRAFSGVAPFGVSLPASLRPGVRQFSF